MTLNGNQPVSRGIRLRQLRLRGVSRDYGVSFIEPKTGRIRNLSVIAGEISTGKTTVLELIDFCLGASDFPKHQEVMRKVRSAQLELELSGEPHVLERALQDGDPPAHLQRTTLPGLNSPHESLDLPTHPAGDPGSLSSMLLEHSGLAGIQLKEAPTQDASGVDPLSFRNVMWLCFLPFWRLDNRHLLFENEFIRNIKLRQTIEVIFSVHDNAEAELAERIQALLRERAIQEGQLRTIQQFLEDQHLLQDLPSRDELEESLAGLESERAAAESAAHKESGFADQLRVEVGLAAEQVGQLTARRREIDTLLQRLIPLQAQYADDLRRLTFIKEAKTLFDPLRVKRCPACLSELSSSPTLDDGTCSLCGSRVGPTAHEDDFDVEMELRATSTRLSELKKYVAEVEGNSAELASQMKHSTTALASVQRDLNQVTTERLAPFAAVRETIARREEELKGLIARLDQRARLEGALAARRERIGQLRADELAARERLKEVVAHRQSKDELISALSARFAKILADFRFPKLADAYLDDRFVPHVRGVRYTDVGSGGAYTLISLAWQLAIFEHAFEVQADHPGFLLLDSPQKNLKPVSGESETEFQDPRIGESVYRHLINWSLGPGSGAQLVIVDNNPPSVAAGNETIVVRYSGMPDQPPYGLIDDETS